MTRRRDFTLKDIDVYRPYPDEIPYELLELAGCPAGSAELTDGASAEPTDADLMRVAKLDGEAVGVYQLRAATLVSYELIALAVSPGCRGRGVGRWLLGHAIGIAESRGGREIRVRGAPLTGIFARTGFVAEDGGLVLRLTPE